jgi:ribosomal protein S18 acetylase RimI-like enzyme
VRSLRPLTPEERPEVRGFLHHPRGLHIYLESRLDSPEEGEGLVYRDRGRLAGFAWFGTGRNLVLAGEDPGFLDAVVREALEREARWLMLVAPWAPASIFLDAYLARTKRRPRLDRSQRFYAQDGSTLPDLGEADLEPAREEDLDELVPVSARMSSEDFEIDFWRIDKRQVRRRLVEKVRDGRAWVYREEGRIVFKADVAVTSPSGVQIEGVYTAEDHRGRGIASRCMAEVSRRLIATTPIVTLHVASHNTPARKAYERAGFLAGEELRLSIFPYSW